MYIPLYRLVDHQSQWKRVEHPIYDFREPLPIRHPLQGKMTDSVAVRPFIRGSVHIQSSNISQSPEIDPRYASTAYDLQYLVEAGKFSRKIAQTEPLASFLVGEYSPGLDAVNTDEEWEAYAREAMITIYHYAGTCAMLPKEDGGVVDSQLRVWGTKNLRVVDASVVRISFYFASSMSLKGNPPRNYH